MREETKREVSQTLPYQTKHLYEEGLRQRFHYTGFEKSTALLLAVGKAVHRTSKNGNIKRKVQ